MFCLGVDLDAYDFRVTFRTNDGAKAETLAAQHWCSLLFSRSLTVGEANEFYMRHPRFRRGSLFYSFRALAKSDSVARRHSNLRVSFISY